MSEVKMRWCVIVESMSRGEFYEMNVFDHSSYNADLQKIMKKRPTRAELSEELRHITMYYFWSKCEYEIIISSWLHCNRDDSPVMKIDVYDQLKMNWDNFVDYVWQFCPKKCPGKEVVSDEL